MADAHIEFGRVTGGIPVLTLAASETVSGGSSSSAAPAGVSVARIVAVTGAVYAAVGAVPDASGDPRVYVPAGGFVDMAAGPGAIVSIENV